MMTGGIIVFDDYKASTCRGAKAAVDQYLINKKVEFLPPIESQLAVVIGDQDD